MGKLNKNEELLLKAKSVDEVKSIVAEHGGSITEEEANEMYAKIQSYDPNAVVEVSVDELDAVSGGGFFFPNRSALREGCKATVEGGSACWGNDSCDGVNVVYFRAPEENMVCPKCGTKSMIKLKRGDYRCHRCKYEMDKA